MWFAFGDNFSLCHLLYEYLLNTYYVLDTAFAGHAAVSGKVRTV